MGGSDSCGEPVRPGASDNQSHFQHASSSPGRLQTRTDDGKVRAFRATKTRIKLKVLFRKFEMQAPGTPSVDQLLVLLTVVEEGSFTGAARRLRRVTSAISYAIDTLEAQLGLTLFDRATTRKPKLTRAGEAIVSEARAVAHSVEMLRARVRGLLDSLESGVSLVVDSLFPSVRLVATLDDFHTTFPAVPLRLSVRQH